MHPRIERPAGRLRSARVLGLMLLVRLTPLGAEDEALGARALPVATVVVVPHQPGLWVSGEVLSLGSLLQLRSRYTLAAAARAVALAEAESATALVARLERLHEQGEGAKLRELELARQGRRIAEARATQATLEQGLIEAEARLGWGEGLAAWVAGRDAADLAALWSGEAQLLRVDLPRQAGLANAPEDLEITPLGAPARRAQRLTAARSTADPYAATSWLYRVPAAGLASGQRLPIWWPLGVARPVLTIPSTSVLWFAGRPWVWQRLPEGGLRRLPVRLGGDLGDGRIEVRAGLEAGMSVVVEGGSQLLGEELRGALPDQDED